MHGYLLGRPVANICDSASAAARYAALVDRAQPQGATFWQQAISAQVFLGDAAFVEKMQAQADPKRLSALAIPRGQRGVPGTWPQFLAASDDQRNSAGRGTHGRPNTIQHRQCFQRAVAAHQVGGQARQHVGLQGKRQAAPFGRGQEGLQPFKVGLCFIGMASDNHCITQAHQQLGLQH